MNRMRWLIGILLALLVIGAAPAQETVTIPMREGNQSGQSGTVTLKARGIRRRSPWTSGRARRAWISRPTSMRSPAPT
jgi:hypothetical protein